MNTLKFIVTAIFFTLVISTQPTIAQNKNDIKILKNKIKSQKNKISANEEVLMSGIKAFKRVKANLDTFKKSKKATKENITRKEKIVDNIQAKLSKLNSQIENQKKELVILEKKLTIKKSKKETKIRKQTKKVKKVEVIKPTLNTNNTLNKLALRKQELENAHKKLEEIRKAKEIAYLKEQQLLHLEAKKLKQIENEIKAEEKSIVKEKSTLISDYEDDISINQEILNSGKEGLAKMKSKLNNAKLDSTTSKESITRKEAIIIKIEERLNKIQAEINEKQVELNKLKR